MVAVPTGWTLLPSGLPAGFSIVVISHVPFRPWARDVFVQINLLEMRESIAEGVT
jgi:hypothetical protein